MWVSEEKLEKLITKRVDEKIYEIKDLAEDILVDRIKYLFSGVDDLNKSDVWGVYSKIKSSLAYGIEDKVKDTVEKIYSDKINTYIKSEEFLDRFVERINRKQIRGLI